MHHLEYGIHSATGRSALGRIYRATRSDGVEVALQVINPDAASELDLDHLRETLRGLERVHHHAVPGLGAVMDFRGDLVIRRAWVDGFDVASLVSVCAMTPRAAVEVAGEVAGALTAVAGTRDENGELLGLRHGDLKPSNIQLSVDGEVAVVGFGQGKMAARYRDRTLTRFVESLGYMAPERLDNQESDTSDVYSLALCLFYLITGEIPARASANPRRHEARVADSVQLLREVLPESEHGVVDLIAESLVYDPSKRPTTEEFGRRCARLLESLEGPRLATWAVEWIPVAKVAQAPIPYEDDGGRLSSVVAEAPLGMVPLTLSPAPATPRDGIEPAPVSWTPMLLGLASVVVAVLSLAFLAAQL